MLVSNILLCQENLDQKIRDASPMISFAGSLGTGLAIIHYPCQLFLLPCTQWHNESVDNRQSISVCSHAQYVP